MFSIWFFLWLILSGVLLYFLAWTLLILFRQKKAWQDFARKKNLRYVSKQILSPPEMNGNFEGYSVSLFTGEHAAADMRGVRKLTAVEFILQSTMPIAGGIASGGMVEVVQGMQFKEEVRPNHEKWSKAYIAAANHSGVLESYLTPERLAALLSLMSIKNAWVILVFREDMMLLRFDTPEPLDHPDKIEKIMKRMLDVARLMELKPGEDKRLKSESLKRVTQSVYLNIADKDLEKASALTLEDDDQEQKPPETSQDPA